jgi:hypothetical protein
MILALASLVGGVVIGFAFAWTDRGRDMVRLCRQRDDARAEAEFWKAQSDRWLRMAEERIRTTEETLDALRKCVVAATGRTSP